MSDIHLSPSGPPETILPPDPAALVEALAAAGEDRDAIAAAVIGHPRNSLAWAALGAVGRDPLERYAAYRVGYHRGLDSLRANGWRGSGYVRWRHESNRGFLRALEGLRAAAAEIGEVDEEERCGHFLHQCDPEWPPADLD